MIVTLHFLGGERGERWFEEAPPEIIILKGDDRLHAFLRFTTIKTEYREVPCIWRDLQ